MKRILCALFGHPDTYLVWGAWTQDAHSVTYRVVLERCVRCERPLHRSTLTFDEVFGP